MRKAERSAALAAKQPLHLCDMDCLQIFSGHHILDTAVREISPAAVAHISSASARVREAYELVSDMTAQGIQTCVSEKQGVFYTIGHASFPQKKLNLLP